MSCWEHPLYNIYIYIAILGSLEADLFKFNMLIAKISARSSAPQNFSPYLLVNREISPKEVWEISPNILHSEKLSPPYFIL